MHGTKTLIAVLTIVVVCGAIRAEAADFQGESALEFTRRAVSFGPRPPGSAANRKLQDFIRAQIRALGWEGLEDAFTATTPKGQIPMRNIIARRRGTSGRAVVFTGHFDTKLIAGVNFVGANDGGASTGFLLEMARVLAKGPRIDDVYLVWFDGEEAFVNWSATDGIYGSRHLAEQWKSDGTLTRIKALINVDMIGDRDLGILQEAYGSATLRRLVWTVAAETGYQRYFLDSGNAVEDDHMPFVRHGVNAIDLIDFEYGGPSNPYWHNEKDTIDKLSAHSLQVVGDVLIATLSRLERQ